ncbi:hypothetical protein J3R30DRAFT_67795 [Lentinula aciculospora]|uniref:Uncharacterized protein n=1 Tax=Lentinula aciculospora TaxID=153920 RepID=A0A9W9ATP2_9AGAR|nr:hypothetical protein J3R30DRAFT_67795 [Lentinula aciculospora]
MIFRIFSTTHFSFMYLLFALALFGATVVIARPMSELHHLKRGRTVGDQLRVGRRIRRDGSFAKPDKHFYEPFDFVFCIGGHNCLTALLHANQLVPLKVDFPELSRLERLNGAALFWQTRRDQSPKKTMLLILSCSFLHCRK